MVEEVILNAGCGACHEIGELGEAGKVGPSLNNIGNTAQLRVPGQPAKEYLYNSIIYPNIFIAPECPNGECLSNVMPGTYHLTLSDQQVSTLVNYMLTLTDDGAESITTVPETAHLDENKLIENESSRIEAAQTNVPIYLFIVSSATVLLSGAALILWIGRRKRR